MVDVDNFPVAVDEDDVKRDKRVLHPETNPPFFVENEEHPLVFRKGVTVHQAGLEFHRGVRNLDAHLDSASRGLDENPRLLGRGGASSEHYRNTEEYYNRPSHALYCEHCVYKRAGSLYKR